jgi:bifunctional pyridoxal-dependent enzyme with beta-cystathionase and maltose regulon repressor activities
MIDRKKTIHYIELDTYFRLLDIKVVSDWFVTHRKKKTKGITTHTITLEHPFIRSNISYINTKNSVERGVIVSGCYSPTKCLMSNDPRKLAKAALKEVNKMYKTELKELSKQFDGKCNELISIVDEGIK